jgi:two-component system sensor histidine kinase PhoQ
MRGATALGQAVNRPDAGGPPAAPAAGSPTTPVSVEAARQKLRSVLSLRARFLLAAIVLLTGFVVLAGLALENAFRKSLLQAQEEKLQGLVYALLGAASTGADGELTINIDAVPDPRLRQPLSGLEAALFNESGHAIWSNSASVKDLPHESQPGIGEWSFARIDSANLFSLGFGLRWFDQEDDPRRYTAVVVEDAHAFDEQMQIFRNTLWGWLGGSAIGLTLALLALLRWGLAPLNLLARELQRIETGSQTQIEGQYPAELHQLAQDLNAMIVSERNQQTRYRNALGDLAHTLKTPLAVLRGVSEEDEVTGQVRSQLREQVGRMMRIVDHQLRRAAAAGSRTLSEPVVLRPLADKLCAALAKVYLDKGVSFDNAIDKNLRVRADQGDLYELLGNLLDNAAKYGRRRVRVSAIAGKSQVAIVVEDDGPGFPENPSMLLGRGVRADSHTPGQGIGLSVVDELVKAYEGRILFDRSSLGGGKILVALPAR